MAVRKIYTNEDLELEIKWSSEGIHLYITHQIPTELPPVEFTIDKNDLYDLEEDLEIFIDSVRESNNSSVD